MLVRCLRGLVHYLRFVKLRKSHLRHLFQPWIFYFIYCCNFPWVCKTVMLFFVTLYTHFINKWDWCLLLFCVLWLFRLVTKYFIIVSVWLEYNLNPYDGCIILWNKWFFIWTWILMIWLNYTVNSASASADTVRWTCTALIQITRVGPCNHSSVFCLIMTLWGEHLQTYMYYSDGANSIHLRKICRFWFSTHTSISRSI